MQGMSRSNAGEIPLFGSKKPPTTIGRARSLILRDLFAQYVPGSVCNGKR